MEIFIILSIPVILALASLFFREERRFSLLNAAGHFIILIFSVSLAFNITRALRYEFFDFFYIDPLSAFFILVTSAVNFASAVYSMNYIRLDVAEGLIKEKKAVRYYALFNLFTFTMYMVTALNNMGMAWVAIEMTTLVSAFLVGFYNRKGSVEAAWKYIIICSVGISLALLGTIFFYYTASRHGGIRSLDWTGMMLVAQNLDPKVLKIAFLFILVGYGTKAGLAPMHTWLPDAHSQSPAPISALLSGVLLKISLYIIIRYTMIVNKCMGPEFAGRLLIFFGLLSIAIAAGFILAQKDAKRLLGYSSIEHIGIISLGFGIGGVIGFGGALFHVFNHAMTKALMFLGIGGITRHYKTSDMRSIRGAINAMPFAGSVVIISAFALAGSPPFSIFVSEIMIAIAGFGGGHYIATVLFLLMIAVIFGGFIHHISEMVFGKKPENITKAGTPLGAKLIFLLMIAIITITAFVTPLLFNKLLGSTVNTLLRGI